MIKILYNNTDAFGSYPLPLIGVSTEEIFYGEKWGQLDSLTLNGQITGCSFDKILSGYEFIKSKFRTSYKPLTIWQINENGTSGIIYESPISNLQSFNIPNQNWLGILDYTIELQCYPSGFFSGAYGILDPNEEWSFEEGGDYRGQINHTISCKGFNTSANSSNALDNAREWALAKTGTQSFIQPAFIKNINKENLCFLSQVESIDRFNGTYSISESYTTDLTRTGAGILRYSTSIESGDSAIVVNLNGSVEWCGQNITGARQIFNSLDKYGAALLNYRRSFGQNSLNPTPISYNVSEDQLKSLIEFSYTFDNDCSAETYFDYTVSVNSGDNITVSVDGIIKSRGGDAKSKLEKSLSYSSGIDLYSIAKDFYNEFYPNYIRSPLNGNFVSSGRNIDEFNGTVALNAEFNSLESISGLQSIDYTLSFQPRLRKFDSQSRIKGNGIFSVVDLGYTNRAVLSINGTANIEDGVSQESGVAIVKNKINSLFSQYGRTIEVKINENSFNFSKVDKKVLQFNSEWSFHTPSEVIEGQNYSEINTLSL
jgi:hypothetical protein